MRRFILAIRCFFALLFKGRLPVEAARYLPSQPASQPASQLVSLPAEAPPQKAIEPPKSAPAAPPPAGAVELLALLQREGRLVDFLEEPIDGYSDAQVGAAVRDIHGGCRKVLGEYFAIEPVMAGAENAPVQVDGGFDQTAIRLVGNVVGQPPYRGVLRHHGWRTTRVELPNLGALARPAVLAPAEVELS
jgi:hypothetical protein